MKSKLVLIISIILVALGIVGVLIFTSDISGSDVSVLPTHESNTALSEEIDLTNVKISSILPASELNGNTADHVKGSSSAPVIIYEYADYQCSGCATVNPWIEEILESYGDNVAIVFRSFPLNIHPNAPAASAAVEAAARQGYWHEYGNLLFSNQSEWYYAKDTKLANYFISYFRSVAGDSGDVKKFKEDLYSSEVKQKVAFDTAIGSSLDLTGTPSFYDDNGELIDWYDANTKDAFYKFFQDYINAKLAKKGIVYKP